MRLACAAALGLLVLTANPARAADPVRLEITIRGHRFEPPELRAPADTAIIIIVKNADDSAEEFESAELKFEKIVAGGRQIVVRVQPQSPGRYPFFGEFHQDTAQGALVVEK